MGTQGSMSTRGPPLKGNAGPPARSRKGPVGRQDAPPFRREYAVYSDDRPGNTTVDFFVRSHSNFMSSDNVIRSVSLSAKQSQLAGKMSVFSIYSSHADYCCNSEDHTLQIIRTMLQPIVKEASQNRVTILTVAISPIKYRSCVEP